MFQGEQGRDTLPSLESSVESEDIFKSRDTPSRQEPQYFTGIGRYYWDGGHIFEGQIRNGKMDGFGELIWNAGLGQTEKYEGIFKDGVMSLVGTVTWADGT